MRNKVKLTLLSVFIWRYFCFSVTEVETMRRSDDIQLRMNLDGPERGMITSYDSENHPCHELATTVLSGPL